MIAGVKRLQRSNAPPRGVSQETGAEEGENGGAGDASRRGRDHAVFRKTTAAAEADRTDAGERAADGSGRWSSASDGANAEGTGSPSETPAQRTTPRNCHQFFPLLDVAPPFESGEMLRVTVPASTMREVGLPVNEDHLTDRVYADVLVGQEGLARAIRFVSYEQ